MTKPAILRDDLPLAAQIVCVRPPTDDGFGVWRTVPSIPLGRFMPDDALISPSQAVEMPFRGVATEGRGAIESP